MMQTLETDRFEIKINDLETDGPKRLVATIIPFHRAIYEAIISRLPAFVRVTGRAPEITIQAKRGEQGIEVVKSFLDTSISHNDRLWLHDLARQGMAELTRIAPALAAARVEILTTAKRMAPGFFQNPERLDEIEIGFVRIGRCAACESYHAESLHGKSAADALGGMGRTLAAIKRAIEADKVPVIDSDGLFTQSGFKRTIIEELTAAVKTALKQALPPVIVMAEDKFIHSIDRARRTLEKNRAALARAGVEVPAMKLELLALIAAREKRSKVAPAAVSPTQAPASSPAAPHDPATTVSSVSA